MKTRILSLILSGLLLSSAPAIAQETDEEEVLQESIVVTGTRLRVTQGGAQDINYFRGAAGGLNGIPEAGTITAEGLLSGYDLVLAEPAPCAQTFCLSAEAMPVSMISRPKVTSLVGLGFGTNLTEDSFKRAPVTIIAVVDKSGSMSGEPLDLAKEAMLLTLDNLRPGDRMGVVQYGSTTEVIVPVSDVETDRKFIREDIQNISSGGSTAMEAGLKLAYKTAFDAQDGFDGTTRVMLYTDERPNVGNTDKDSFIGMAVAASERGVGLTTIGVADHFGAELANQVSAARGGNLFYLQSSNDAEKLFAEQFDFLMTEVAQDLSVTFTPRTGQTIEAIYGVPGEMIEIDETGSRFTIPTVFLSNKAGGVFLALSGDTAEPNIDISLTYKGVIGPDGSDQLAVTSLATRPSKGLQSAALLVDEFEVLTQAALAYEAEDTNAMTAALSNAQALKTNMKRARRLGLKDEVELLGSIEANLQIALGLDFNEEALSPLARLNGPWVVKAAVDQSDTLIKVNENMFDRGDILDFDLEDSTWQEVEIERRNPRGRYKDFDYEDIRVNEDQILFEDSGRLFTYEFEDDEMALRLHGTEFVVLLKRPDESS
ncbi:MAG: VWA domain-containing protein [Pseudomonadota bacterium]